MELENIKTVTSLCCGVIGYSWALKFAMSSHEVYAYNRSEESSARAACVLFALLTPARYNRRKPMKWQE